MHPIARFALVVPILFVTSHATAAEELRAWTSANGKFTTKAKFVEISGKNVKLKREDGKVISVPIAKLGKADRDYLRKRVTSTPSKPKPLNAFVVDGAFSIAPPNSDYAWQVVQQGEEQGIVYHILACRSEKSADAISLVVEHRPCSDDAVRVASLKATYNAIVGVLQKAGFTDLKGTQPPLEGPIPNDVTFFVSGKTPDGEPRAVVKTVLFRQSIFTLDASAETVEKAQELLKVSSTLKQLGSPRPKPFEKIGLLAIDTPPGFSWEEVRQAEFEGIKVHYLRCGSQASTSALVLTVERRSVDENAARAATIKANYNALVDGLKKGGFTDLQGQPPRLTETVPARVGYQITGKTADGVDRVFLVSVEFRGNVHVFQSIADTQAEAKKMLAIANSLKEYSQKTSLANRRSLDTAIKRLITIVEQGDPRATLKSLLPPDEFAAVMQAETIDEDLANFNDEKAPRLLAMLKSLEVANAKFLGSKAGFEVEGDQAVSFARINGQWFLMN